MYKAVTFFDIPNPMLYIRRFLLKETWHTARSLIHITISGNKDTGAKLLTIMFGSGAGHKWGLTIYLARNCIGRETGLTIAWDAGCSNNWKQIPFVI